jgi:hypothetical protein
MDDTVFNPTNCSCHHKYEYILFCDVLLYFSAPLGHFQRGHLEMNTFVRNIVQDIPIYIQKDATLHSLLYLETALHVSAGTSTHHQERIQLYIQHLLFVTPLLLPAASGMKHVEQFPNIINCVTLHLVGYILEYSYDARTHKR